MSEILKKLVELKKQEVDLKIGIAEAQKAAIEEAINGGVTGTIACIDGAKIIFKLTPVKPKPTEEILELQKTLDKTIEELKELHSPELCELEDLKEYINDRLKNLLSSSETRDLSELIQQKNEELQGEMQPQISITLPK